MPKSGPWRLDPSITFLNHGSFGSCPAPVLAAQAGWRDRMEADPIRFLGRELEGLLDAAREEVARFIRADADGIAFVPNATTGVNTVLRSLRFEPGDELLTTDHEYNATINALRAAAKRDGATVVVAAVPFPILDPADVTDAILRATSPRTQLALFSHVTSPTGIIFPIDELVRELEERGVATIVDAAHSPGMVGLDVGGLGASYWTGNGHKWLCAPKGASILHVRRDRRDAIHPLVISHGANAPRISRSRFRMEFDWLGTVDPTPYLSLPDAIRFGAELMRGGWPALMAANHRKALEGRDLLCGRLGLEPAAPDEMLGSMAALELPVSYDDDEADRLCRTLAEEDRIEVPINSWSVPAARPGGRGTRPTSTLVRISMQHYNSLDDVARLADVLAARLGRRKRSAAGS